MRESQVDGRIQERQITMARTRHTPEQIINKLRAIEVHLSSGKTQGQAARQEEVSVQKTVQVLRDRLGASERRACKLLKQPRATQRYLAKVRNDEGAGRTRACAVQHGQATQFAGLPPAGPGGLAR